MKAISLLLVAAASVSAIAIDSVPQGASVTEPNTSLFKRWGGSGRDRWGNCVEQERRKVTIRASRDDHDDVSDDFLWGIKRANHGGLLVLEKGKTYVIGKKLDLTFLNDIYVKLDGEIKVGRPFPSETCLSISCELQGMAHSASEA